MTTSPPSAPVVDFARLERPRVLIVALSGIGNLLMASPLFRALKASNKDAEITVLVAPRGTADVLERNADISQIFHGRPKPNVREWFGTVQTLQRQQYTVGIITYPGQLIMSASLTYFGNVRYRVGHRYTYHFLQNTHLFLNAPVAIQPVHDVPQNCALLKPLGIHLDAAQARYAFPLAQEDHGAAESFLQKHNLTNQRLIGFHPGTHTDMTYKRWPAERWADLGQQLARTYDANILLFGGPEEQELRKQIAASLDPKHTILVDLPLRVAAAVIRHCLFFVSNDSGLMHVAVSQNIPTFGLFGPTDEQRTAPWGPHGHVIRARGTKPTYTLRILPNIRQQQQTDPSLLALSVEMVLEVIQRSVQ